MTRRALIGFLLLAQVIFGSLAVAGKLAFENLAPATVAFVRIGGGALFLVIIAHGVMRLPLPRLRDIPALAILGLLGVVLNQLLYLEGLKLTTAVGTTLMQGTIPLWTGFLALVVGQERPRADRIAGLALGFAGIAVLVLGQGQGLGTTTGNILVAANALSYAGFLVYGRRVVPRLGPVPVFAWAFLLGSIIASPYTVPSALGQDWAALPIEAWLVLAYILLVGTILAHGINVVALKHTQSSTVAGLIYLQPIVGASLAIAVLGETPGVGAVLAGILVLAGVALVLRAAKVESDASARDAIEGARRST